MKQFFYPSAYLGALACIFVGAAGFLLLRFLPPSAHAVWVLPLLSLMIGFLLLIKLRHLEHALFACLAIFACVWGLSHFVWPRSQTQLLFTAPEGRAGLHASGVRVPDSYRSPPFHQPRSLYVPAGTRIEVFRSGLKGVRWLAFSSKGDLFASLPRAGEVVRLVDDDRDGYAEQVLVVASDLDRPHGLAFDGSDLVVAGESTLYRLPGASERAVPPVEVISRDMPAEGGHWTRSVVVGPERSLLVAAGSSCNACEESDARRASVRIFPPEGGHGEPFASGLRNSVGLVRHPDNGDLWGSDNGRDMLGDDLPADELNLIRQGLNYGWPFCYGEQQPDPQLGDAKLCADTVPPEVSIPAHSAPLGLVFGTQLRADKQLQDSLLVAYHGSWNRSQPTGYKIVAIPFENGRPNGGPFDVVTGWLEDGSAWGRPVALAVDPHGSLFVSDDRAGAVYRITFGDPERSR